MPPGEPKALRTWFYSGDNFGQEFAYPKHKAVAIAAVSHAEVPSTEAVEPAELPAAAVDTVTEPPKETIAEEPAPAAPPVEIAEVPTLAPEAPAPVPIH